MQIPGAASQFFLLYLLLLLPWMAIRSSRTIRRRPENVTAFSDSELDRIWCGTILNLTIMFVLAWAVGNGFGFQVFAMPALSVSAGLATVSALSLCLLIRIIVRRTRTDAERQKLVVFALAPRTRRQWLLKSITVLVASVAEESAYRGVGWAILSYSTGNVVVSALVCCLAFAVVHWMQGWKSMLVVFLIAGIMHGLVWCTKSLVPAIIVHGVFDFIAIYLIAIEAADQRRLVIARGTEETDHE